MVAEKTDKFGLVIPGKDYRYIWYQLSGPLYSMGGKFIKDGKFDVTSPEYKEMFRYWVDLVKEGAVPKEALGWSWTDAPEIFARGRAAMLIAGAVNTTRFSRQPSGCNKRRLGLQAAVGLERRRYRNHEYRNNCGLVHQ